MVVVAVVAESSQQRVPINLTDKPEVAVMAEEEAAALAREPPMRLILYKEDQEDSAAAVGVSGSTNRV